MGVDTVFNSSAQMDNAAALPGQPAQFLVWVTAASLACIAVEHRFGDRSEGSFVGGRVQAFGLLVNFLAAESNSEVALLKELIHEVTSVACAVLNPDDQIAELTPRAFAERKKSEAKTRNHLKHRKAVARNLSGGLMEKLLILGGIRKRDTSAIHYLDIVPFPALLIAHATCTLSTTTSRQQV